MRDAFMKNERGYICSVTFKDAQGEFWFGTKANPEGSDLTASERYNTNGLKPFSSKVDAQKAQDEILRKRDVQKAEIVKIKLDIAETGEDVEILRMQNNAVVIVDMEWGRQILGLATEKGQKMGYIPGSLIETNGRQPFTEFWEAEDAVKEVRRQAQSHAAIARLKTELVEITFPDNTPGTYLTQGTLGI